MFQDVKFGLRMLLKHKGMSLIAIVTLGLGIGANTAIFSVVQTVLLRPLSYREPEQLVRVWETNQERNNALEMTSQSNLHDWQEQNRSLPNLAAWQRLNSLTLTSHHPALELRAGFVSPNYFSVLGVEAALGRTFLVATGEATEKRVVIISDALWQSLFAANPQVVGAQLEIEKVDFQIIGILPRGFKSPAGEADLWLPINFQPNEIDRGQTYLQVIGRLHPDVTLDQAQADMDGIAAELARQFPDSNRGRGIKLVSLTEQTVGGVRRALLIVMGAVGLVLLIACANVANLFLVRAAGRQREFAIRSALGASGGRLLRQLLTEATLIALAGGALGLLAAVWVVKSAEGLALGQLPRLDEIHIDGAMLLFSALVTLLTGALFGLAPALTASRARLNDALKDGSHSATGGWLGKRLQSGFVVAQVALALMLLVGAGLLTRSFVRLVQINPGFHSEGVLVARLLLSAEYEREDQQVAYFRELTERLKALPGVLETGAVTVLPMNSFGIDFDVAYHRPETAEPPRAAASKAKFRATTPNYFQALGMPVIQGRSFIERDRRDSPRVVIVNQAMAERVWPDETPLGKSLRFFWADWQTYEVIGVVGNAKSYGLAQDWQPELFVPHAQIPYTVMNVVVRTAGDPAILSNEVRRTILAIDPYQPAHSIVMMKDLLADSLARDRFAVTWIGTLAGLALALASLGIYSVLSYITTRRTREIGIRQALGAHPRAVFKLVVGQGLVLTLTGIGLGLLGAVALTRVMASLLFGVTTTDALTFAVVPILLLIVALLACYLPARRAMKVDPMIALRHE